VVGNLSADAAACGSAVPEPRRYHSMAWFFVESPVDFGSGGSERWVQRGVLLHGGVDESSGAVLDDEWLLDLTHLGTGACPWISLGNSGIASFSGGLAWDPTRERFVFAPGYLDEAAATAASDGVWSAEPGDLASGLGWSSLTTLPSIEYAASDLGDTTPSNAGYWPSLDCNSSFRQVPCAYSSAMAGRLGECLGEGIFEHDEDCDDDLCSSGTFYLSNVKTFASANPCLATLRCDGTEMDNDYYQPACAEDPICLSGGSAETGAYDSANVAGLAEFALGLDPNSGDVLIAGGTTGCEGDCSAWSVVAGLDDDADEHLATASADPLIVVDGSAASLDGYPESASAGTAVPPDSTHGRRGAAGAVTGPWWSFSSHAFSGTGSLVQVGGTLHQDLGRGRQHQLRCEFADGAPGDICNFCMQASSDWIEGDRAYSSATAGLVDGWDNVAVYDAGAGTWDGQGDIGQRIYAAATWFGDEQVLVWGGEDPWGELSDISAWDTSAGARTLWAPSEPWGGVSGGAAAYDPVTRTAFLFGGGTDDIVYTYAADPLAGDQNLERTEGTLSGSTLTAHAVNATLGHDGSTWRVGGSYAFSVACASGSECFAEDAIFLVATESATEIATLQVVVTYPDTGASYTIEPHYQVPTGDGFTTVYARLPRIVTEGMDVQVAVEWESLPVEEGGFTDCVENKRKDASLCRYQTGGDDTATPDDERTDVVILAAVPVVPGSLGTATDLAPTTTFTLPAGWQGVAPGAPDTALTTFSGLANLERGSESHTHMPLLIAAEGLSRITTLTSASASSLPVWIDPAIDRPASAYADFLDDGTAQADLDWLEATVAALPGSPVNVLVLARSAAEEVAWTDPAVGDSANGEAFPGLTVTWAAHADGVPLYYARATALHEIAHQATAFRVQPQPPYDAGARWVVEGVPTLLTWMRLGDQPVFSSYGAEGQDEPYDAALALATATCANSADDMELDGADDSVAYMFGPYSLMQLYWTYRAHGGSEPGFWANLVAFFERTDNRSAATVDELISTWLAEPTFYTEWVRGNREGTPLLAVTRAEADTSACLDTGACEPVDALLTVDQVQLVQLSTANGCLIDAPSFSNVPYFVYCGAYGTAGVAPFEGCEAGAPTTIPNALSAASVDITLTLDPAVAADPFPARVQLLANDNLLPGWMPTAGFGDVASASPYRRFLVCADPSDTECGGDADGDGWPARADCDDSDASYNPAAAPLALSDPDNNCDGW